jgi:hypothetical protein
MATDSRFTPVLLTLPSFTPSLALEVLPHGVTFHRLYVQADGKVCILLRVVLLEVGSVIRPSGQTWRVGAKWRISAIVSLLNTLDGAGGCGLSPRFSCELWALVF